MHERPYDRELDEPVELFPDDVALELDRDDAIASAHDWPEHYGDELRLLELVSAGAVLAVLVSTVDPTLWRYVGGALALAAVVGVAALFVNELRSGYRDRPAPFDWSRP